MMETQGQVMQVRITNKNDFPIQDRFDGVPFLFEPNQTISIPSDAAYHIFGFFPGVDHEQMVRHIQKRFGWNTPDMIRSGASNKFVRELDINPVIYKLVPVEEDIPEVAEEKRVERKESDSFLKAAEAHRVNKMGLTN